VAHQPSETELGEYVDRLLAKSVLNLAKSYQAGSIVIPNLTHIRDILDSEMRAKAEQKCPGSVEAQAQYAKEYRQKVHRWSYNRLIEAIQNKAHQLGIPIEPGFQSLRVNPQEQARDLAIAAYHCRGIAKKSI
jgi:IS605 OrfB family transposase